MNNIGCAGCHRRTDPPGLALEHFDGLGQLRTTENDAPIDVSVEIRKMKLEGAQGLGKFLHDDPRVPACLVRNIYAYGVGRKIDEQDEKFLDNQSKGFASVGYRLPRVMVQIASSPEFFRVVVPGGVQTSAPASTTTTSANQKLPGVSR
jgi:hypothetical protein